MIGRLFLTVLTFQTLLLQGQNVSSCYPVAADWITGADLAAAVPELQALPKDLIVGYSPFPGAVRVFRAAQLSQIANRYHLAVGRISSSVCFAWRLRTLEKQEIIQAANAALSDYKADIFVTDQSHMPVPDGTLTLPLQGLTAYTLKPAIWNGYVTYGRNRRFNTWVQVQITVHLRQFVAAHPIKATEIVTLADIRQVDYAGPLQRTPTLNHAEEVVGQCARWPIAEGTVLTSTMLSAPLDVAREDMVTVLISCGAAHIQTQGIAAESGYVGNIIRVRNPKTGRVFRARIDERGVVTVVAGGAVGLVGEDGKS